MPRRRPATLRAVIHLALQRSLSEPFAVIARPTVVCYFFQGHPQLCVLCAQANNAIIGFAIVLLIIVAHMVCFYGAHEGTNPSMRCVLVRQAQAGHAYPISG